MKGSVVTIHQPEHLPWAGFFHKVSQADLLVLLDNVRFRKNYFGNRNRLLGANGPFWATVPVVHASGRTYQDLPIAPQPRWPARYWNSIYYNYKNHPHFERVGAFMHETLQRSWTYLGELNEFLIKGLLRELGIELPIVRASTLQAAGHGTELLRQICREVGASVYLSGKMGREYLEEAPFAAHGIEVRFQEFTPPVYPQKGRDEFVPSLSVLDLLMNCGERSIQVIRHA